MLGVPSSTGATAFNARNRSPWLSTEDLYHQKLYQLSGLILARNQDDFTHSFSTTQRISEELDLFANQMSPDWWEIPASLQSTRIKEASVEFERVMCQIWHFELEILLHLPFMLRAANDRRYEYSQISCLNACRSLIKRWIAIRDKRDPLLFSDLLEFQAFTASTTLMLGLLSSTGVSSPAILQEQQEDSVLIDIVVENFERRGRDESGKFISSQSISAIRALQKFLCDKNTSRSLRLEIPFFGTIKVAHSALQPLEGERLLGANGGRGMSFSHFDQPTPSSTAMRGNFASTSTFHTPAKTHLQTAEQTESDDSGNCIGNIDTLLQLSGGHFHPFDDSFIQTNNLTGEWPTQETDMILFDSLLDSDLVGTWNMY